MDIVVGDAAPRSFTDKDRKQIGRVGISLPQSAKVGTLAAAIARNDRRVANFDRLMVGLAAVTAIAGAVAAMIVLYAVLLFLALVPLLYWGWRYRRGKMSANADRAAAAEAISPPAGTLIEASEHGLAVAGKLTPWEGVAITCVGVEVGSTGGDHPSTVLRPDRLWLDVADDPLHIDPLLSESIILGARLILAVYKRKLW